MAQQDGFSISLILITTFIGGLIFYSFINVWTKDSSLPRAGSYPGLFNQHLQKSRREFQTRGLSILRDAYEKYPDKNFVVQTLDMKTTVVAPKFLPEMRMLPENKLSHSVAFVEKWLGYYNGLDIILQGKFMPLMRESYTDARSSFLSNCSTEGTSTVPTYGFVFSLVLAISSRVFVGDTIATNPKWQEIMSAYLKEAQGITKTLKPYPKFMRPLIKPFVAPEGRIKTVLAEADSLLTQPILDRREDRNEDFDVMKFLAQSPEKLPPHTIVLQLLALVAASLHTSTMAAVQALYDLCSMPEYIPELRAEIRKSVADENGSWNINTVKRLHRLDSFLKESFRKNLPESLGYDRIATSDLHLSDGTIITRGSHINMAAEAMSRDPSFYKDPAAFDGYRFYCADKVGSLSNQSQEHEFAGIEKGNVAWGSGRSTCPGRWYASAMNKLIIGGLIQTFQIAFPDGQKERPESIHDNGSVIPNPTQMIVLEPI